MYFRSQRFLARQWIHVWRQTTKQWGGISHDFAVVDVPVSMQLTFQQSMFMNPEVPQTQFFDKLVDMSVLQRQYAVLNCAKDRRDLTGAFLGYVDVVVQRQAGVGPDSSDSLELPQVQFVRCWRRCFVHHQGVRGLRRVCFAAEMRHFSRSVQLDVSARWRGRLESDSQAFCHPNSVHVCGVVGKTCVVSVSSAPPPPPPDVCTQE